MDKTEILKVLGEGLEIKELPNDNALLVVVSTEVVMVHVTIPIGVRQMIFEARDKAGKILVKDRFDCYGDAEDIDFKECLLDLAEIAIDPKLRIGARGQSIEAKGFTWYHWFGKFQN